MEGGGGVEEQWKQGVFFKEHLAIQGLNNLFSRGARIGRLYITKIVESAIQDVKSAIWGKGYLSWTVTLSMAENSSFAAASFFRSSLQGFAKTEGPVLVRRWCLTPRQCLEAVKLSEECTSQKSSSSFLTHWGAERKATVRKACWGPGEVQRMTYSGKTAWNTRQPLMSTRRLKCCRKKWGEVRIQEQVGSSSSKPWIHSHRRNEEGWY